MIIVINNLHFLAKENIIVQNTEQTMNMRKFYLEEFVFIKVVRYMQARILIQKSIQFNA